MRTLGTCPHCQAHISPLQLLRTSRRRPYHCPPCGGESVIEPQSGAVAVIVFVIVAAVPLLAVTTLGGPRWALFAFAVAGALCIPLALARLCRFNAVKD